jgi:hypothetical protein
VLLHKAVSTVVAQAAADGHEMARPGAAAAAEASGSAPAAPPPPLPPDPAGRAHAAALADALLALVQSLASSTAGCTALADAGVVSSLMPLLRDTHPDHVGLVVAAVRILEALVDFSQSALTLFRWGSRVELFARSGVSFVGAAMCVCACTRGGLLD